jgi:integrase
MSVRKRVWKSPAGELKEAWVVDYVDQHGDRHLKTFSKKRDADAHHAIVGVAVRTGVHTADSKSVTVAKAAELWLESREAAGLERATLAGYRQRVHLHITPVLGTLKLSQLTVPLVRGFEGGLLAA